MPLDSLRCRIRRAWQTWKRQAFASPTGRLLRPHNPSRALRDATEMCVATVPTAFFIFIFLSSSLTFLLTRMRIVLIHETEYALRQHGWRETERTERRIQWQRKRKQRRRGKPLHIWFGTIGDAAMHPRSFFGHRICRKAHHTHPPPALAFTDNPFHSVGSRSGASSARGVSSMGSTSIISSPVAAPSSLNLRADGSTRD